MNRTEINFKGAVIQLVFGTWVMGQLIKRGYTLSSLQDQLKENPFDFFPLLIYLGAVNALPSKDTEEYNLNDFYDFLDQNGGINGDQASKVIKCFTSSLGSDVPKKKEEKAPRPRQPKR